MTINRHQPYAPEYHTIRSWYFWTMTTLGMALIAIASYFTGAQ